MIGSTPPGITSTALLLLFRGLLRPELLMKNLLQNSQLQKQAQSLKVTKMPPKKLKKMAVKKSKTFANFPCYSTRYSGSRAQTPDLQNRESSTQTSQEKIHFRRELYFFANLWNTLKGRGKSNRVHLINISGLQGILLTRDVDQMNKQQTSICL